jgi:sterol desaturase/sphingolipid hydroxylase (fatty acid hydroxylase superfamily)
LPIKLFMLFANITRTNYGLPMDISLPASLTANYQWRLALYVLAAVLVLLSLGRFLLYQLPGLRQTRQLNKTTAVQRMSRDSYVRIQMRSAFWGVLLQLAFFALVLPFIVTDAAHSWWRTLLDIVVILMVYDCFYYFAHRFLFHASPLGALLVWMHAVHHQQKNPCRSDSNYLHPLETCIGLALFFGTLALLAVLMGRFEVMTIVVTFVLFLEINQHNHDLMEVNHFPYKYLHRVASLHHVHHARFTGGNFGTISSFYDRLFGTYDTGSGWRGRLDTHSSASAD